jgi:phosphatidylglycerophosphatase A
MNNLSKIFISIFGIGFIKFAPGTFGSLISLLFYYLTLNILNVYIIFLIFCCVFLFSLKFIKIYSEIVNQNDSSSIVIDEFLGISFIMLFYDYIMCFNNIISFTLIFLLFRFFDIFKFFPANWIDKNIKNSWGVILDDIFAGIYTIISLIILNALI